MQPANLPLEIYRGDSMRLRVKLFDDTQQPVDLTDTLAKSEIRDRPAGTTIVALSCTITLPNIVELFLTPSDSHKLPQQGVWDLQLTYPSGEVQTPVGGQVSVTPDVTDSTASP
jgi:hypothetical protein